MWPHSCLYNVVVEQEQPEIQAVPDNDQIQDVQRPKAELEKSKTGRKNFYSMSSKLLAIQMLVLK